MSKKEWGNITWNFFHSLAEKIDDNYFQKNKQIIFNLINLICMSLPCPSCANDAMHILNNVRYYNIYNKKKLIEFLFSFHNKINEKIGTKIYTEDVLNQYKNSNMTHIINNFKLIFFNRKYNEGLLLQSFTNKRYNGQINTAINKLLADNAFH